MNITNQKKRFFWLFYFFFVALILLLIIEGGIYLFYKFGKLTLIHKDYLVDIVNSTAKEILKQKPIYIPHPYFGYIYTPNNRFLQKTYMESNSEGFIDEEFPLEKKEGLCLYGLLGGSAAMSWGVEKREDRIAYQLEKLLNTYATNDKCKEYRVLNMGVGSHLQYQATQIYLYYQDLLDGVIFYNGNNECSHASILATHDPVPFPEINIYSLIQLDSPLKYKILALRGELSDTAMFLLKNPYLLHSFFIRFFYANHFKNKLQKIDEVNSELMQESHHYTAELPYIRGKFQESRELFKKITPMDFWYSALPDFQRRVIKEVVPIVYTTPLIDAFAVTKIRNVHFLSVVQPLSGAIGRKPKWGKPCYRIPIFQKVANQILIDEAEKLADYGVKIHNLNYIRFFGQAEQDIFIDGTHITPEGNKIVARYLFELIQKEWHQQQ